MNNEDNKEAFVIQKLHNKFNNKTTAQRQFKENIIEGLRQLRELRCELYENGYFLPTHKWIIFKIKQYLGRWTKWQKRKKNQQK